MSAENKLRVLIVDDEKLARQRLEDLLVEREQVVLVGMIDNGRRAVEAIREKEPDLIFLDVQMPSLSGLEVVEAVGPESMPVTVFVTAYNEYALKAFDLAALDYLVKPFDDERFEQAFERAKKMIGLRQMDEMKERLLTLLDQKDDGSSQEEADASQDYLERIAVDKKGQVRVVPVEKINYVMADGPYVELHTEGGTHLIRERMKTLEERLDPEHFFRIHRSVIVRLECIESLLHGSGGNYAVQLNSGKRLKLSRNRREALEDRLGLKL